MGALVVVPVHIEYNVARAIGVQGVRKQPFDLTIVGREHRLVPTLNMEVHPDETVLAQICFLRTSSAEVVSTVLHSLGTLQHSTPYLTSTHRTKLVRTLLKQDARTCAILLISRNFLC